MRTLTCEFQAFEDEGGSYRTNSRNNGSPGKFYDYLYTGWRDVRAGDWALVHNGTNFGIVKISRVRPGMTDKVTKHVISVVTQDDFARYKEANDSINSHRRVFDELDYLLEEEKKLSKYRDLAERNTQAKELLEKVNIWTGPTITAQNTRPVYSEQEASEDQTSLREALVPKE